MNENGNAPAGDAAVTASARLANAEVLVTGGAGFIGSHLVEALAPACGRLKVLAGPGEVTAPRGCEVLRGDLLAPNTLTGAASGATLVYHLAGLTDTAARGDEEERRYRAVNVEGTRNLLGALGPSTVQVVFFSTVYAYGLEEGEGIDESTPAHPTTAYGRSKLEAEELLLDWGSRHGVATTELRLPAVYGPGSGGNVLRMVDAVARRRFVVVGDGNNRRSMVYVGNAVGAALAAAFRAEAAGEMFLVTDGADPTVLELSRTIAGSLGVKPLPLKVPAPVARAVARAFDVAGIALGRKMPFGSTAFKTLTTTLTFSSRKIAGAVGFRPGYDLAEGMAETARWYRDRERCTG